MDTSRYISMCTDRDTVFEACQYLPGDGGWVCYPQGIRDKSMGVTLVILIPVIIILLKVLLLSKVPKIVVAKSSYY